VQLRKKRDKIESTSQSPKYEDKKKLIDNSVGCDSYTIRE